MTDIGRMTHLRRLAGHSDGRILTVALDHAPSYGLLAGIEDLPAVLRVVAGARPDAIMLMKGTATRLYGPYAGDIPLILKCSTLSPYHPAHDVAVASVEDALRLGADAISMAVTFGCETQAGHLAALAALVREAERVGLPTIAHAYPNGPSVPADERYTPDRVAYAARAVMEIGVDIVKTFYTGDGASFSRVVDAARPAIVVAAGGPRLDSRDAVLQMARETMSAGAAGITFGRNVWQREDVAGTIQELKGIVHPTTGARAGTAEAMVAQAVG